MERWQKKRSNLANPQLPFLWDSPSIYFLLKTNDFYTDYISKWLIPDTSGYIKYIIKINLTVSFYFLNEATKMILILTLAYIVFFLMDNTTLDYNQNITIILHCLIKKEKIKLNGWMASPTQWIWVCVNSRSWWRTGRSGVLQSMGSQRVVHDWATELN